MDVKNDGAEKAAEVKPASVSKEEVVSNNFPEMQELEEEVNKPEDASKTEKAADDKSDSVAEKKEEVAEDIDSVVIAELLGEEEVKPIPVENRVAELERKNKELYDQVKATQTPVAPQISDEQMDELFQKDFPNFSPQQCRDMVKFMNDYVTAFVKPGITKEIEQTTNKNKFREDIKADKYYKLVAKDIDEIAKTDEFISSLPEDKKWKQALKEAMLRKLPMILKNHSVKARKIAEENKTLIPSERGAQATPKAVPNTHVPTEWEKRYMKKRHLTEADLSNPNYQGKTVIEE